MGYARNTVQQTFRPPRAASGGIPEAGQAMEQAGSRIYRVRPGAHGRARLKDPVDGGRGSKERRRRAHVLLPGDGGRPNGGWTDARISDAPGACAATAERTGGRCVMEGRGPGPQGPSGPEETPAWRGGPGDAGDAGLRGR